MRILFISIIFILALGPVHPQGVFAFDGEIRYVAIGDSYTVGTGVSPQEAWPSLLADHLRKTGIPVNLAANPSRNGWTTEDAERWEMPILRKSAPAFVTLMIGVNDWVQGFTEERFRANFTDLLEDILSELPAGKILVVNIPDFSVTPAGAKFSAGRDISKGITRFNKIIAEVCKEKGVEMADIYTASQTIRFDLDLVAQDGLHPSAKGHLLFEETIYPHAKKILNK